MVSVDGFVVSASVTPVLETGVSPVVFLLVGTIVGKAVVPGISCPSQLYISGQHSPSGTGPGIQLASGAKHSFSAHITSPSKHRQYLQGSGSGTTSPNLNT